MPEFIIRALLEYQYLVTAENADDAEQIMADGELRDKGECVGYHVDAVVSPNKRRDLWREEDDLRARCECGHLAVNDHADRKCGVYGCDCLRLVEVKAS